MKQLIKKSLLVLSAMAYASGLSAQTITMNVINSCTGAAVPNGQWINFVSGTVGSPFGYYYASWVTAGVAHYSPAGGGSPDLIGCGHIEAANGATLVSISPAAFGSGSTTNYWCPTDGNRTITVTLSYPTTVAFNLAGTIGSGSSATPFYECAPVTSLVLNNTVRGFYSSYEIQVTQGNFSGSFTATAPMATTGTITGGAPGTFDLLTLDPTLSTRNGVIKVTVLATQCGVTTSTTEYFNLQIQPPLTAFAYNLNGYVQSTPTSTPPVLYMCDGASTLALNSTSVTGTMATYTVKVEQGTWASGTFTPNAVTPLASGLISGANIAVSSLSTLFPGSFLSTYNGPIRVTVAGTGPSGGSFTKSQVFDLEHRTSLSALSFNVNGSVQSTPTSTPPVIWLCTVASPLSFVGSVSGSLNDYSVKVEKGTWASSIFSPTVGSAVTTSYTAGSIAGLDLTTLAGFATYSGYIRVTVTSNSACNSVSSAQVYDVEHAVVSVTFDMQANGCSGITGLPRQTTLPIANATFTSAPCITGWQGATSVGIANIAYPAGISSYDIKVDEVNPSTGVFIGNVFDKPGTGSLPNWNFNTDVPATGYTGGYFIFNYFSMGGAALSAKVFKVTVTTTLGGCSATAYSYFRIANGSAFWKNGGLNNVNSSDMELAVYPNPADNELTFEWSSIITDDVNSNLVITDMMGKAVISHDFVEKGDHNIQKVDISSLPAGVYIYRIGAVNGVQTGKFEKK